MTRQRKAKPARADEQQERWSLSAAGWSLTCVVLTVPFGCGIVVGIAFVLTLFK